MLSSLCQSRALAAVGVLPPSWREWSKLRCLALICSGWVIDLYLIIHFVYKNGLVCSSKSESAQTMETAHQRGLASHPIHPPGSAPGDRAAEKIVGTQGNCKKWGPYFRLYEWGLGARPQKILRFYVFWSVFWELLRILFEHAYSTYIPASCRLRLAVSDQKVRRTGP